jgi:hypothetical protein
LKCLQSMTNSERQTMWIRIVALLLIASVCSAQAPVVGTPQAPPAADTMITVPQGTLIALKLISSIKSKSTKPGDPVRAVVSFPLTVGTRVAVPAGTYVDGIVEKVIAHPKAGQMASMQLRFNRLLFANGYSVPLVAANQAKAIAPEPFSRSTDFLADARDGAPYPGAGFGASGQNPQPLPLPPLPSTGPSPGAMAGIGIGAGVGILVIALAINHHHGSSADFIVFDSGWQFEMALAEPLTLDGAQVSAAAAMAH